MSANSSLRRSSCLVGRQVPQAEHQRPVDEPDRVEVASRSRRSPRTASSTSSVMWTRSRSSGEMSRRAMSSSSTKSLPAGPVRAPGHLEQHDRRRAVTSPSAPGSGARRPRPWCRSRRAGARRRADSLMKASLRVKKYRKLMSFGSSAMNWPWSRSRTGSRMLTPKECSAPAPSMPASMIPGPAPVMTIQSRSAIAAAKAGPARRAGRRARPGRPEDGHLALAPGTGRRRGTRSASP